jgi:hypothetical protein
VNAIRTVTVVGLLAACLLLAACGRPGLPRLPRGQSDNYPAGYPHGAKASDTIILKDSSPQDAR